MTIEDAILKVAASNYLIVNTSYTDKDEIEKGKKFEVGNLYPHHFTAKSKKIKRSFTYADVITGRVTLCR